MKKILILLLAILLVSCNNNDKSQNEPLNNLVNDTLQNSAAVNEVLQTDDQDASNNKDKEEHEDEFTPMEVIVGVEVLNVRSEANLNGEVVGQLKKDEHYIVNEIKVVDGGYWYKITYENEEAWIAGWFTYEESKPQIKVFSEMSYDSDFLGYLFSRDVFRITETNKVCAVEISDHYLNIWIELEFNGQRGYVTYVNFMRNQLTFADSLDVISNGETMKFETTNNEVSYKLDPEKNQMLLEIDNQLIYFNASQGISAVQNPSLSGPEITVRDYLKIYDSDNKTRFTLEPDQIYLVDDVLISESYRMPEGKHTLVQYSIVNGELSLSSTKELSAMPYQQVIDVYSVVSRDSNNKPSDALSINQLNQYECEANTIFLDEAGISKYYQFTRNNIKQYVKEGFRETSNVTNVVLPDGRTYTFDGDIDIKNDGKYLGEFFEYRKDNIDYFYNGNAGVSIDAEHVFYDPYLRYVVIVNQNQYEIFKLDSNFDLLYVGQTEGYIGDVYWESDQVVIELGEKHYNYLDSFNGRLIFNIDSDGVSLDPNSSEYVSIYDRIGDDAHVMDTLTSFDRRNIAYSLSLSLSEDHMTSWAEIDQGYLKKEYLGYRNRNNYWYSQYSSESYDALLDGEGNVVDDEFVNFRIVRSTLEDQGIYILLKDYAYYAYNVKNHLLVYLGANYSALNDGRYIVTSEKTNNQLVVKLFECDSLSILDEIRYDGITYEAVYSNDKRLYINNDISEVVTLNNYFVESIILEVQNNHFVSVNPDSTEQGIPVYDGLGKKSKIIKYIATDTDASLEFLDTYELIDGKMVMWYKLISENVDGFIYKPFREVDSIGYQYDAYDLIYEDGTKETIEIQGDCVYNYVTDDLGAYGYFTSYYAWEGPPGGSFYNMTTKEIFHTDGQPYVSPDGKFFFSFDNGYMEIWSHISIYKMNEQTIEPVYDKGFGEWEILGGQWISNTSFVFDAIGVYTHIKKKLIFKYENGEWHYSME